MKLKRILALAVSLAMVLSIVPAFEITAGAATSDMTDDALFTYAKTTTALFDLSSANINWSQSGWNWDTEIASGMSNYGWTLTKNSGDTGTTNMACGGTGTNGKIQHYYSDTIQWAGDNPADIVTMGSGFGAGSDWALFSFTPDFSVQYGNVALYDVDGNIITAFRMGLDSQLNINWGHSGWGTPYSFSNTFTVTPINTSNATQDGDGTWKYNITSGSSKIDILFRNNTDNYTATYFIDDGAVATVTYDAATFNGIGGLGLNVTHTTAGYQNIALSKFAIYANKYPADTTEYTLTVNYGTTGTSEVLTGISGTTVKAPAKQITVGNTLYVFNEATYTITGTETVTLEPAKTLNAEGGLIAHYSLESDLTDSVNANTGSQTVENAVTFNRNGYATFPGGVSKGALTIPFDITSVLPGNFTISMWVKQDSSYEYDSGAVTFWEIAVGNYERLFYQQAGNVTTIQDRTDDHGRVYWTYDSSAMKDNWALVTASFDLENGTVTNYVNGTAVSTSSTTGTWSTKNAPANFKNGTFYLGHNNWNDTGSPELKGDMAEVRIYNKALTADEVTALLADKKTVKVNYVSDIDSSVINSTTVDYFTSEATFDLPTAFSAADGTAYELTGYTYADTDTSVTVTSAAAEFNATYTTVEATATGVEEIKETVEFIEGTTPFLPKTVTVLTNKAGITYTANVNWNSVDSLTASTTAQELKGTVEGYTGLEAKINVIKYPETFNMSNMTAYPGQNAAAIHYFPTSISGEAVIEFDAVFKRLINGTITIGDAASNPDGYPIFGGVGDAISIQTNSGGINIRSWGANGGASSADRNVTTPVTIGDTYHFLIKTNTGTDTWSAVMIDKNGVSTTVADGHGYRMVVDKLDSVTVLDNDYKSDTIDVSNFRVYAATTASTLEKYTVKFVFDDGSTRADETVYDVKASVDALPTNAYLPNYVVPEIGGYVFTDYSLSGTTYTLNYAKHIDTIGTWFTRNNVLNDDMLISDMNFLGAHDAFTAKMTKTPDAASCIGGDEGAKGLLPSLSTTPLSDVSYAQAQTATPAELLRNGVRYFDVRLSVSDATEDNVPTRLGSTRNNIQGTNGELYTTHGYLCQPFRTTLYEIRDICRENPGEVLILDFQEFYNTLGSLTGGHDDSSWDMTAKLLREILGDYLVQGHAYGANGAATLKYGDITNGGKKAAVICIGRPGSQNTQSDLFYRGGDRTGDQAVSNDSRDDQYSNIYSYWTTSLGSYEAMITDIKEKQLTYIPTDHKRFTVMQAIYGEFGSNSNITDNGIYVSDHIATDNPEFESDWIRKLKIFMTDSAHINSETYIKMFAEYNRDTYTSTYDRTYDGVRMTTAAGEGANVPLSSILSVTAGDATGSTESAGDTCSFVKSYTLNMIQYDNYEKPAAITGNVTLEFPGVSTSATQMNVLLQQNGTTYTELGRSRYGENVSGTTATLAGSFIVATVDVTTYQVGIEYVDASDTSKVIVRTEQKECMEGDVLFETAAETSFYIKGTDTAGNTVAHILKSAAQTVTAPAANGYVQVPVTMEHEYAVLEDAFHNASDSQPWNDTTDLLFAGANGVSDAPDTDDDNAATFTGGGTVGEARIPLLNFKVPTVGENEAVKLHLYVAEINGNLGEGGTLKLAANVSSIAANETNNAIVASAYANLNGIVWSDAAVTAGATNSRGTLDCGQWVEIDVTEFVKAATAGDIITFAIYAPRAGAYIADRESAVLGGDVRYDSNAKIDITENYEGKAAYLDIVSAHTVNVTSASKVTKNGTNVALTNGAASVTVPATSTVRITPADNIIVFLDDSNKVYEGSTAISGSSLTADTTLTGYSLGVSLIDGAQVRIGAGVKDYNSLGYKINTDVTSLEPALASSGLRFIAVIDGGLADSRDSIGAKVGVEIYPTDSPTTYVRVDASNFQDAPINSVFSAALVNLSEGNYNRAFTAKPYVYLGDKYYYGSEVSRSVYEIAAGILADINVPVDGNDKVAVEVTEGVCRVLNAYVNQVGIRLELTGVTETPIGVRSSGKSGAYQGGKEGGPNIFFTINSSPVNADGTYSVEITANGSAQIFGYWNEYIRLNNQKLADYITGSELSVDGKTLTLTISTTKPTAASE